MDGDWIVCIDSDVTGSELRCVADETGARRQFQESVAAEGIAHVSLTAPTGHLVGWYVRPS